MKEVKCEGLQATVVQHAAENNFKSVLFATMNCSETASLAREVSRRKLPRSAEFRQSKGTRSTLQIHRSSPSRRAQKLHFCEGSRN